MKKYYYLLGAAGLLMTSCANDELVTPVTPQGAYDGAITFNMRLNNQTRDNVALNTIMDNFGVYAFKTDNNSMLYNIGDFKLGDLDNMDSHVVMNDYRVGYEDNVFYHGSHWTYVSEEWSANPLGLTQYLKYFDGSFNKTYFFPYAPFDNHHTFDGANHTSDVNFVRVDNAGANPDYVLSVANVTTTTDKSLEFLYGDITRVTNANFIKPYDTEGADTPEGYPGTVPADGLNNNDPLKVPITFHHGMAELRLAFHENIPGYRVVMENVVFNGETDTHGVVAMAAVDESTPGNYVNTATADVKYAGGSDLTASVTYSAGVQGNADLDFTIPEGQIGETHATKTPSPTSYYLVPNPATTTLAAGGTHVDNDGLQFVMNYRLESVDTKEVIHVKGARVFVSKTYTQWEPNKVYTYVFQITRNSTGTTTGTTPDHIVTPETTLALYPIIFDGVEVAEAGAEEYEWIVNGLQLSETNVTMTVGAKKTLTASIDGNPCPSVTWGLVEGEPGDVVSINTTTGEIEALKAGTTKVKATVTDADNTFTATCTITVQ